MFPLVISEALVQQFKFVELDGSIHRGIRYGMELYSQIACFTEAQRLRALRVAYEWGNTNKPVIVTHSQKGYTLWLGLRSPIH